MSVGIVEVRQYRTTAEYDTLPLLIVQYSLSHLSTVRCPLSQTHGLATR